MFYINSDKIRYECWSLEVNNMFLFNWNEINMFNFQTLACTVVYAHDKNFNVEMSVFRNFSGLMWILDFSICVLS